MRRISSLRAAICTPHHNVYSTKMQIISSIQSSNHKMLQWLT
jgi:hypothetical protein